MLLKCIGNKPSHLSTERAKDAYHRHIHQERVYLEVGRKYISYGIGFWDGVDLPWFLVFEGEDDEYPTPHIGEFFEIVIGEIPEGWEFSNMPNNFAAVSILPKRWADDSSFMEKMDEGEASAMIYLQQLKVSLEIRYRNELD